MVKSSPGDGLAAAFRAAPLVLKVPLTAFAVLLAAEVVCVFAGASSPGNALLGAFGLAAALLGLVLEVQLAGLALCYFTSTR